jgi:hypothetical protein
VLIDVLSMVRVGDRLVSMIFMCDRTHLLNFASDKVDWPGYITIGNLSSIICQMPSTHSIMMVALLPMPIMNHNNPQKWLDEKWQINREVRSTLLPQSL